jgi:hypothetical protein
LQKDSLKKTGLLSFDDNTAIVSLKKELLKVMSNSDDLTIQVNSQLSSCNEREEAEKAEITALETKRKDLDTLVQEEERKKRLEVEPKILYYTNLIEQTKVQ